MENPKNDAKLDLGKGGLKQAVHGVFAKVQSKTGLEDKKIDEFQEKWLAIPENRTKYKHLVDAPTIVAEELFAIFNDIIDFLQAQEAAKSHVLKALRAEALAIKNSPQIYLGEKMDYGKSLWQKGVDFAKCLIGKKAPIKIPDGPEEESETEPKEELSDFEKAEMEDEEGVDGKMEKKTKKTVGTQNFVSKTEKKTKSKTAATKGKRG